jgi:hypothetical protein
MSAAKVSPLLAAGVLGLIAAVSLSDPAVSAWPHKEMVMHAGPSRIDCSEEAGKTSLVWQTEGDESNNHLFRADGRRNDASGGMRLVRLGGVSRDARNRIGNAPTKPSPYAPPVGAGVCAASDFI